MQENEQNVKRIPVASGLQPGIPDSKRGATQGFSVAKWVANQENSFKRHLATKKDSTVARMLRLARLQPGCNWAGRSMVYKRNDKKDARK
jgi:ribosomal protein L35